MRRRRARVHRCMARTYRYPIHTIDTKFHDPSWILVFSGLLVGFIFELYWEVGSSMNPVVPQSIECAGHPRWRGSAVHTLHRARRTVNRVPTPRGGGVHTLHAGGGTGTMAPRWTPMQCACGLPCCLETAMMGPL
jgi:hypothetical protein